MRHFAFSALAFYFNSFKYAIARLNTPALFLFGDFDRCQASRSLFSLRLKLVHRSFLAIFKSKMKCLSPVRIVLHAYSSHDDGDKAGSAVKVLVRFQER